MHTKLIINLCRTRVSFYDYCYALIKASLIWKWNSGISNLIILVIFTFLPIACVSLINESLITVVFCISFFKKVMFDPLFLFTSNTWIVLPWHMIVEPVAKGLKLPFDLGALTPINPGRTKIWLFQWWQLLKNISLSPWPFMTAHPCITLQPLSQMKISIWNAKTQQSMDVHPFQTTSPFSLLPFLLQNTHGAFL